MYKTLAIVVIIAVACSAFPQESEYEPQRSDRIARATCDLLSASVKGITLNHSACTAHCLVLGKGFKGGRCRDGICHCRK